MLNSISKYVAAPLLVLVLGAVIVRWLDRTDNRSDRPTMDQGISNPPQPLEGGGADRAPKRTVDGTHALNHPQDDGLGGGFPSHSEPPISEGHPRSQTGASADNFPDSDITEPSLVLDMIHDLRAAFAVAKKISSVSNRDMAVSKVVDEAISRNALYLGIEFSETISSTTGRNSALEKVFNAAVQSGNFNTAEMAVEKVRSSSVHDRLLGALLDAKIGHK